MLLVVSCQDNFDEWEDTDQRSITFDIHTEDFFDDFLASSGTDFVMGPNLSLQPTHRLRVACYCYDAADSLVQYKYSLRNNMGTESISLRHLDKNQTYRFELFTDVVRHDDAVDFYETWFPLGTENLSTAYLFCFQPDSIPEHNIVRHQTLSLQPANNKVEVRLDPFTVNGYCILSNLQSVDYVSGYWGIYDSFFIKDKGLRHATTYNYQIRPKAKQREVIPVTLGAVSDIFLIKVRHVALNEIDSAYFQVKNPENRPFVLDIDCATLKQKSCVYY